MFSKAKGKVPTDDRAKALPPEISASSSSPAPSSKKSAPLRMAGVPSIISADVVMRGNINSSGEIQFDGSLEGDIKASTLIVGEKASVKGEIVCEFVTVRGRVEGGIRAKQVALAATAHIVGDILHSSLSVENGAHFDGNCRHSDDPLAEASTTDFRKTRSSAIVAPAPKPAAPATPEESAARSAANEAPAFLSQTRSPLR
jgi:cytoskeletal protein CcmA (bactofilin family)